MFWPLAYPTMKQEEITAARRVLESGNTTMGVNVAKFEAEFAKYHGMNYGIMVNSGSSANLVATAALCYKKDNPLKRGDRVVVPAIAWATTYAPLHQYGLKLRIVDVDLETLNIDPMVFQHYPITDARMIVGVSILGNPAPLDWFADSFQMKDRNIILFEDNCESLDAFTPSGQRTGTFGLVNTFSFFFTHHLATMEGGMILTNDYEIANLCKSLRNHGWTRGTDWQGYSKVEGNFTPDEEYNFILPGYNVRPMEVAGAIGLEQLKKLPEMTRVRRKNWKLFQHLFKDDERFIIQKENGKSSAFAFTLICRDAKFRDEPMRPYILDKLRKAGIGFRMVTGGNILRHPVIKHFDSVAPEGGCPNADKVHYNGFFVGNHPYDLEKQIYTLQKVLADV